MEKFNLYIIHLFVTLQGRGGDYEIVSKCDKGKAG